MMTALLTAMLMLPTQGFYVKQVEGDWWFIDPSGKPFQSIGVCCVNRGIDKKDFDELNPGYAASRSYSTDAAWAKDTLARMKRWGFNTVGAWSDHTLLSSKDAYQSPVLHLSASGIPWVDMWDPKVVQATKDVAAPQIKEWSKVPGVIGYFSDNELGWWIGAQFEWAWKMKPEFEGRRKLIALTKSLYPQWSDLLVDFVPSGAENYSELSEKGRLFLRPGGQGSKLARAWLSVIAERYYNLCRDTIREFAPQSLFLGDRFISGYYPEVATEAGKVCDVVSTNLNADWPQGEFAPYYLDGLYALTHKPILITEYYACSMSNRSGNMNDASGFPTLANQAERARSAQRQTTTILGKPYVVGAHWFQYYDEPTHGRGDGENYNMGLVDINNEPYAGLVKTFHAPGQRSHATASKKEIPYISPLIGANLASWPHDQAVRERTEGDPRGDLFLAWNESGLYVAAYWKESRFGEAFYQDGKEPEADRPGLKIKIAGMKDVIAVVGQQDAEVQNARLLKAETGVNNTLIIRIPANALGTVKTVANSNVPYSIELTTAARTYTMRWTGTTKTMEMNR